MDATALDQKVRGTAPEWKGSYHAADWRHGVDWDPDTSLPNVHGPVEFSTSFTEFSTDRLQELLRMGSAGLNLDDRKKASDEVTMILAEEVPEGYLYRRVATVA